MPRRRQHTPLRVLLDQTLVGHLTKELGGNIVFRYDAEWLAAPARLPVSLSLPLRADAHRGEVVAAFFENLLPDSEAIRRQVAERVGAGGSDAYSLLAAIGRDCVGALQFVPEGEAVPEAGAGDRGEILDEAAIERLLQNLPRAPLGLSRDDGFRISIAGAQEKTALHWDGTNWRRPVGVLPTTHILKPAIGRLPNGVDFSDSIENEFYCLVLLAAFGLPVNAATIATFGRTKALVIERFDRRRTQDGTIRRLPQEDFCQALGVPPGRKYQSDGGPGVADILKLLGGSDAPDEDRKTLFKAQILFWLIGATDGHARNFSLFLGSGGSFRLTLLYDVLTTQPALDARQIERKQMRLAMSVGDGRHYRIDEIAGRHFLESAKAGGLPRTLADEAMDEIIARSAGALEETAQLLPSNFPPGIHGAVVVAVTHRVELLQATRRT